VLSQPGGHCSLSIGSWTPEELQRSREAAEKKKTAAEAATSKLVQRDDVLYCTVCGE
jgi:hypothetical protein